MSKNKKSTIKSASPAVTPKRRWLNIGPGLILALALSVFIGYQWVQKEINARKAQSATPIIERHIISSSYDEKAGIIPEVKFIIDHRKDINLTSKQLSKIQTINSIWLTMYRPKIKLAQEEQAKVQKFLDEAKNNPKTPVSQIQDKAASVIKLSGEISTAKYKSWNQAVKVLTEKQRAELLKLREGDWARKKRL